MPTTTKAVKCYRGKRSFDIFFASAGLFFLSPVLSCLCICIRKYLGLPVLFKQVRPGIGGKPFILYKFRTMTEACDAAGNLLPDSKRLTKFGRFLRSSSLDELPELWNVLKGDMSFVGPSPLLIRYLKRYTPEQTRRHEVKPGVTGWAQVNGRNAISWEEKFKLDVWYIDNQSFWIDIKIILMTLFQVIRRNNINAAGHATMPEFLGSNGENA